MIPNWTIGVTVLVSGVGFVVVHGPFEGTTPTEPTFERLVRVSIGCMRKSRTWCGLETGSILNRTAIDLSPLEVKVGPELSDDGFTDHDGWPRFGDAGHRISIGWGEIFIRVGRSPA